MRRGFRFIKACLKICPFVANVRVSGHVRLCVEAREVLARAKATGSEYSRMKFRSGAYKQSSQHNT